MTSPAEQAPSNAADGRLRQGGRALLLALYSAGRAPERLARLYADRELDRPERARY